MRKLKKLTALALASTMVFSSFNAFAATPATNSGATLQQLSIISGDQDGNLNEEGTLTREESMVIALKLMGVTPAEDAASDFTDVPADHWAATWIGAAQELGVTAGMGDGTFGLGKELTSRQAVAIILNTLGYEDTYKNASELGLEAGIVGAADVVALDGDAVRGDVFDMMSKALAAKTEAGEGVTLMETLIAAEVVTEELAIELGYKEEVKEYAVDSMESLNLIQFQVTFSEPVDEASATDLGNYESKEFDFRKASAKLVGDDTVVITLAKKVAQQKEGKVTVTDVKNLDEVKVPEFEGEVKFVDNTFPEVVDATVVGKDTIMVTFSEPMVVGSLSTSKQKAPFGLKDSKGNNIHVKKVTESAKGETVLVEFYKDFAEEEYSLTVSPKYSDYAGFTFMTQEFTLDIAKDTEAPYIVDVKDIKPDEVTLVFNEPVKAPSKADVYHTNSKNGAEKVELSANAANEVVVTFPNDTLLPSGRAYIYVKADKVKDMWDNKNDSTLKYEFDVAGDDEKPVLEKVAFGATQKDLVLTFSEKVEQTSAVKKSNYKLIDGDGDEVVSFIRTLTKDKNKVNVELRKAITSGDYTLVVEDIEDLYGNEIAKVEYDFNADDVTAPDFANVVAKVYIEDETQNLVIDFKEAMDTSDEQYSITNLENYRVEMFKLKANKLATSTALADYDKVFVNLGSIKDDLSVSTTGNGSKVQISLDTRDGIRWTVQNTTLADYTGNFQIARVKDAAGNETADLSASKTFVFKATGDPIGVHADGFRVLSSSEAKLTLDGKVVDFEEDDFIINAVGSTTTPLINVFDVEYNNSGTNTVVTFTIIDQDKYKFNFDSSLLVNNSTTGTASWQSFATGHVTAGIDNVITVTSAVTGVNTSDEQGEPIAFASTDAADKYKPELNKDANGYVVYEEMETGNAYLVFQEPISLLTTDVASDLAITFGKQLTPGYDFTASAKTADLTVGSGPAAVTYDKSRVLEITFTAASGVLGVDGDLYVDVNETVNLITDAKGNKAKGSMNTLIYNIDTTPSVKTAIVVDKSDTPTLAIGDELVVEFTESVHGDTVTAVETSLKSVLGAGNIAINWSDSKDKVTVTITTAITTSTLTDAVTNVTAKDITTGASRTAQALITVQV